MLTRVTSGFLGGCPSEMNLVFVLDSSGSIGRRNWRITRDFLAEIVTRLDVRNYHVHASVVTFSGYANIEWYLHQPMAYTRSLLLTSIRDLWYYGGSTATPAGLQDTNYVLQSYPREK